VLATGATPGMRLLPPAVILMPAFPTPVPILPLLLSNEFQAAVFIHHYLFHLKR